jgi:tRNA nucleotidyltransferase (CCA-adding enzyme)
MAYNPKSGIADPFGGRDDIKKGVIRCVGNADTRFDEDALRILRAMRFSSTLGFEIEQETSNSIIENCSLLKNISKERIRTELIKLLCGKNVEYVLTNYKKVIFEIIPELAPTDGFLQHTPYHIYDVWTHTIKVTSSIEAISDFRVAALLHDVAKPEMFKPDSNGIGHFKGHPQRGAEAAEAILRRLRFSNAEIKHITSIIYLHDERPDGNFYHLAKLCSQYGIDNVDDTLKLIMADAHGKNPTFFDKEVNAVRTAQNQIAKMREEHLCLSISELDINGNDIMSLGIDREKIKETLQFLLDEVVSGKLENKKTALLQAARQK